MWIIMMVVVQPICCSSLRMPTATAAACFNTHHLKKNAWLLLAKKSADTSPRLNGSKRIELALPLNKMPTVGVSYIEGDLKK